MSSKKLIRIEKEEIIKGEKRILVEYITESYVYMKKGNEKSFIYLRRNNKFYEIDIIKEKLLETSQQALINQIRQINQLIPNLSITKTTKGNANIYSAEAKSSMIILSASFETSIHKELLDTAYLDSYLYHKPTNLVNLPLGDGEIINKASIITNINGNSSKVKLSTTDIEEINSSTKFDHFLKFSVSDENI